MLACVVNVSEGRRPDVIDRVAGAGGISLLDVHSDVHHNRSVLTLAGPGVERAARQVAAAAVEAIDLRGHEGVHPRFGAVDVVPFVPLWDATLADALDARDRFAARAAEVLELPCFLYGIDRSLPEVRRSAFSALGPDGGPDEPHPTAGAVAVGARPVLVAYNAWLAPGADVEQARAIAREIRGDTIHALGLPVGERVQVSMNLIQPMRVGPAEAYDAVAARATVERAELVGLVPQALVAATPSSRWPELDLDPSRTIEARLRARGLYDVAPPPTERERG